MSIGEAMHSVIHSLKKDDPRNIAFIQPVELKREALKFNLTLKELNFNGTFDNRSNRTVTVSELSPEIILLAANSNIRNPKQRVCLVVSKDAPVNGFTFFTDSTTSPDLVRIIHTDFEGNISTDFENR
jgi:hypothetical protein